MAFLSSLFGKKKRTLEDLSLDELSRERITLQQKQRQLDQENDRLEKDERQLKSEYGEAETQAQKKRVARKIQDLRQRQKSVETRSAHCHKMLQTVNNFVLIKENMQFFEEMGVGSVLANMDTAEIETFINNATVEGELQQEKLATLLSQVSDGVERMTEATGDCALDELMSELDQETAGESIQQTDSDLAETMSELDAAIEKGEQAARQARTQQTEPTDRRQSEEG